MKKLFIENIFPGDEVVDYFLVRSKNKTATKNGKPYLDLELQDRTGVLSAKVWDRAEEFDPLFKRGDLIKIKAIAESYRDRTQIRISQIRRPAENEPLDPADFVPATDKYIPGMLEEILAIVATIQDPHLALILKAFFDDDKFRNNFMHSVAARDIHHAYVGGLIEHTLQVTKLAVMVAEMYPALDRDLLVTMAILHDLGKIVELQSRHEIIYTKEGYLIGHITLGLQMLDEQIRGIEEFPEELALRMRHILLSHHGEREFGSPILPQTPEAITLHFLDNLDAKINTTLNAIARDKNKDEDFTKYHPQMERHFYKGTPKDEDGE